MNCARAVPAEGFKHTALPRRVTNDLRSAITCMLLVTGFAVNQTTRVRVASFLGGKVRPGRRD
jgi:hypothetical protein